MKKRILSLSMAAIVCGLAITVYSCKKKEDPTPEPDKVVVVDTSHNVLVRKYITLYIPENKNESGDDFKFYNITNNKFSNDVNSDIELAFVYDDSEDSKHHLGSSRADKIKARCGISATNSTEVKFYNVKNEYSTMIFDTLTDDRTIDRYFNKYALDKVEPSGNIALIKSDELGWDTNDVFAFKLPNGKRGLIKLEENPNIIFDLDNNLKDGRIVLSIKLEK